jgi:molybdenum cofactor cytidylyltransferase
MSGANEAEAVGIVLAAGLSRRLGRPKLGLTVAGRPLLRWAVDHCLEAGLGRLIVVAGPREDPRPLLPDDPRLGFTVNPEPEAGQNGSLRVGLAKLPPGTAWAAVFLGDMPCVWPEITRELLGRLPTASGSIVRPAFDSRPGHPVVFQARWFERLSALRGDAGGREVVAAHPDQVEIIPFAGTEPLLDVDTEADLAAAEAVLTARIAGRPGPCSRT